MEDDVLYELPTEFLDSIAASSRDGRCDAQAILAHEGRYLCHCSCGRWKIVTDTSEEGLALARQHTAEAS